MEGWRQRRPGSNAKPTGKKNKNRLDTNRPSHGRTWPRLASYEINSTPQEHMKSLTVRIFTVIVKTWAGSNGVTCRHPIALWQFLHRNNRGLIAGKFEL